MTFTGPSIEALDTAILSTIDADLSQMPSLYNTMEGNEASLEDTASADAWLDPAHDIFSTPSQEIAMYSTHDTCLTHLNTGDWAATHAGTSCKSSRILWKKKHCSVLHHC